ncbi:MAG TPA: DUF5681 domain-containing protein [Xanthobacteraceae bacterium]
MTSKKKRPTSAVGYGRPPVHSRFRKGQSGNPAGRLRQSEGKRARKLILQEAFRMLNLREGDKVTRIPALQAVLRSQIALAAKGNGPAQRAVVKTVQDIEAEVRAHGTSGAANRKLGKDLSDLTDQELMAILGHDKRSEA